MLDGASVMEKSKLKNDFARSNIALLSTFEAHHDRLRGSDPQLLILK